MSKGKRSVKEPRLVRMQMDMGVLAAKNGGE